MKDLKLFDKYRNYDLELKMGMPTDSQSANLGGCFLIPTKGSRRGLCVILSTGEAQISNGWDHVSVSLPNRTPTWEEMCKVKDLFFEPDDVCFQLHPKQSDNISNHRYCLHIWHHPEAFSLMPPAWMVGDQSLGDQTRNAHVKTLIDKYHTEGL